MDEYAGGIDDGAQGGGIAREYTSRDAVRPLRFCGRRLSVVDGASRSVEFRTDCRGDWTAPIFRGECGDFWPLQEFVDGRQLS